MDVLTLALPRYATRVRVWGVRQRPRQVVLTLTQDEMAAVDTATATARVRIRLVRATRSTILRRAIVLGLPLLMAEMRERG